jgi:hypothetical protein
MKSEISVIKKEISSMKGQKLGSPQANYETQALKQRKLPNLTDNHAKKPSKTGEELKLRGSVVQIGSVV